MYRVFGLLAALIVAVFPASLGAQARGGHGGGVAAHSAGGFAGHGPVTSFSRAPVSSFRAPFSSFRGSGLRTAPFARFARPVVVAPFGYSSFYSPFYSPYYSPYDSPYYSPYDMSSPAYSYSDPTPAYTAPPAPASDTSAELAYQVGQLSQQIADLRAEQSAQRSQAAVPSRTTQQTLLIFRDGHRQEIQNYAIVGQTLWIFDEHNSTRMPLSELDLTATQNVNRQRGIRFAVPE